MDISSILAQGGGGSVYPLPRIVDFLVHPKLNLASLLFAVRGQGLIRFLFSFLRWPLLAVLKVGSCGVSVAF